MKTAVLLLNHYRDAHLYSLLRELIADCEPDYDVWLLSDRTKPQLPLGKPPKDVREFRFKVEDLVNLGYEGKQGIARNKGELRNLKLGNAELPVMLFSKQHQHYKRLWVVEYDVRYTGNWKLFFDHFDASDASLITTTLTPYDECIHWNHWGSVSLENDSSVRSDWVRGFLPVYRIDAAALEVLDERYRDGVTGHVEGLMPTLVQLAGLTMRDIGGQGSFVVEGDRNRFYSNSAECNSYSPGTFVYRPALTQPGDKADTLWHPVKPEVGKVVRVGRYLLRKLSF